MNYIFMGNVFPLHGQCFFRASGYAFLPLSLESSINRAATRR